MKQLWNGVSAVPRRRFRKGERHWRRGEARDGGHSFCFGVASFDGSFLFTQILSPTLE